MSRIAKDNHRLVGPKNHFGMLTKNECTYGMPIGLDKMFFVVMYASLKKLYDMMFYSRCKG